MRRIPSWASVGVDDPPRLSPKKNPDIASEILPHCGAAELGGSC